MSKQPAMHRGVTFDSGHRRDLRPRSSRLLPLFMMTVCLAVAGSFLVPMATSSTQPAEAAGTWEQVNAPLTGASAPFTATETIGGVAVSVASGFGNTYGPGGNQGGSFYSFYSTNATVGASGAPTSVTWSFTTPIRQMKFSYGYVGDKDPEFLTYSTDGTSFQPIDLTSSVVTGQVGSVEGSQSAASLNASGRLICGIANQDCSGELTLTFSPTTYPMPIKAIRATGATPAAGTGINIVGVWLPTSYSVTYYGNGSTSGTAPVDSNSYLPGATLNVATNSGAGALVRTGYAWEGWTTDAAGTGTKYSGGESVVMAASDLKLYALWSPFSVTYDGNGATSGSVPVDTTPYTSSGSASVLGNTGSLAKSGYVFDGWTDNPQGTGTVYTASSPPYSLTGKNVVFYAKWSAAPTPPAPPPAPVVEDPPSPPQPVPSAPPVRPIGTLDPIPNQVNRNVPAAPMPPGQALYLVDGQPTQVRIAPDAPRDATGIQATGDGWWMKLVGRGDDADPLGLSEKQVLILQSDQPVRTRQGTTKRRVNPVAQAAGAGFKANSIVKFYLLPSTALGQLSTDGSGAFAGNIPVPPGIKPGAYTLQMNGYSPADSVRSLSIGVIVKPTARVTRQARAVVTFDSLDPTLDAAARKVLKKLLRKTGKLGIRNVVLGFVQPTSISGNDASLSTERARNVAAFLKSRGLKGTYVVRGEGKAPERTAIARRVAVTITYEVP